MMRLEYIFNKCLGISTIKRADYATDPTLNPHENFQRSAEVASWFINDMDKPYAILVATKLARLGSLLGRKLAKNESVEDTFLDLVNYCALWAEARTSRDDVAEDSGALYEDQRVHEEIAKSYTESTTKPANITGVGESNVMKIIKLSNDLTAGDVAALRDYFKDYLMIRTMGD